MLGLKRTPTTKDLDQITSLMNLMGGGDKKVKKAIEEMRAIAEKNETLLNDLNKSRLDSGEAEKKANASISQLNRERAEFDKRVVDFKHSASKETEKLDKRERDVSIREAALKSHEEAFDRRVEAEEKELSDRVSKLDIRESQIKRREIDFSSEKQRITSVVDELKLACSQVFKISEKL